MTNPSDQPPPDPDIYRESLEELYEQAPCGYLSTTPDGSIAKVNQTFLAWSGYQRQALLGSRLQDLFTVGGKMFYETHYRPLLAMQGEVREVAFEIVCADGGRLPVFLQSALIRDAAGAVQGIRTTVMNASDRRAYERELQAARDAAEQALLMRDQFIAVAAHELKTPLTTLLGTIQLLQRRVMRDQSLNPRDQRMLQVAADQANRLNRMIHSLLDVSRIEGGHLAIDEEAVDVGALVRRVVDDLRGAADSHPIAVEAEPALVIRGDALRLEQVFQNLIQNAAKYSPPDAPIHIAVRPQGGDIWVAVRDEGIGIPDADLPYLFQRFYRAANVHAASIGGMGIGLSVVKDIVTLHGGTVTVSSREHHGSTFTVVLPGEGRPRLPAAP